MFKVTDATAVLICCYKFKCYIQLENISFAVTSQPSTHTNKTAGKG